MKHEKLVAHIGAVITSLIVLGIYSYVTWWSLEHEVAPSMKEIFLFVAGNINAMATAVVAYWVGSSSGSLIKSVTGKNETEVRTGGQPPQRMSRDDGEEVH